MEVGGFFGLYFWRFRSKYCPWWRDVPGVENTNGTPFKQWSSREEGGAGGQLSAGHIITITQPRWLSGEGYQCWDWRHRD